MLVAVHFSLCSITPQDVYLFLQHHLKFEGVILFTDVLVPSLTLLLT